MSLLCYEAFARDVNILSLLLIGLQSSLESFREGALQRDTTQRQMDTLGKFLRVCARWLAEAYKPCMTGDQASF